MMKTLITASLTVLAITTSITGASAKDWIEKVRISQGGIDQKVISVRANSNGYTTTTSNQHKFKLSLYAKAKSGKRIAYAEVGRVGVRVDESDPSWTKQFTGREIGLGLKRTWMKDGAYNVPLNQVEWYRGKNPVRVCNDLLAVKINRGQSKSNVLKQTWNTEALAHFGLAAAAARPNVAQNGLDTSKYSTYTEESSSYKYKVRVRCLAAPNHNNQVQSSLGNESQGNASKRPGKSDKILKGILQGASIAINLASGKKQTRPSVKGSKLRPLRPQ